VDNLLPCASFVGKRCADHEAGQSIRNRGSRKMIVKTSTAPGICRYSSVASKQCLGCV